MLLVSGHTRSSVIQNKHGTRGPVVYHIDKRIYTRMEECGVAYGGNPVSYVIPSLGLLHTVQGRDRGTHADGGIDDTEGSNGSEGVASDVTGGVDFQLVQNGEYASVRTAGAENGRTRRRFLLDRKSVV